MHQLLTRLIHPVGNALGEKVDRSLEQVYDLEAQTISLLLWDTVLVMTHLCPFARLLRAG